VFDTYTALMAPAKTPPEAVAFLEKQALAVLAKPDLRKKLTEAGFEVTAKNGKGHMARVQKEVPMFKQIIADAGIKLS
jgi:tripartite-type tricarboxylate transporter receptor subunit TctC